MFKFELKDYLTVEEYARFLALERPKTHDTITLPDGRMETWYKEEDLHDFLTKTEELIPNAESTVTTEPK